MSSSLTKIAALLLLLLVATDASASVIECRGCTFQTMSTTATNMGTGSYLIWNPINAEIHDLHVHCGRAHANGAKDGAKNVDAVNASAASTASSGCVADEQPTPGSVVDLIGKLSIVFNRTGATWNHEMQVDTDNWTFPGWTTDRPTAKDYVSDGNLRGMLNNKLNDEVLEHVTDGVLRKALEYVDAHAAEAGLFTDKVGMTVTAVFSDRSSVRVQLPLGKPAVYLPGYAVDAAGHALPDPSTAAYAGK